MPGDKKDLAKNPVVKGGKGGGPVVVGEDKEHPNHKLAIAILALLLMIVLVSFIYFSVLGGDESLIPSYITSKTTSTVASEIRFRVEVAKIDGFGRYLVNADGMTLYVYLNDSGENSVCYGECAKMWHPFLSDKLPVVDGNLVHRFGLTQRGDTEHKQVIFDKIPLYTYVGDEKPGDVKGHGTSDLWYALSPLTGPMAEKEPPK